MNNAYKILINSSYSINKPNNSSITNQDTNNEYLVKRYFNKEIGFNKYKPLAIELLKKIIDILNKFNIDYFLISGTLLGYIRHNDLIPWDDDIDLMIDASFYSKKNIILSSTDLEFKFIQNYLIQTFYKNQGIVNKDKNWPYIDLFIYSYNKDKTTITFFNREWDVKYFFPLQNKNFLNMNVSIPRDPHYFLKNNYSEDYMTTLVSHGWNHKRSTDIKDIKKIDIKIYNKIMNNKL